MDVGTSIRWRIVGEGDESVIQVERCGFVDEQMRLFTFLLPGLAEAIVAALPDDQRRAALDAVAAAEIERQAAEVTRLREAVADLVARVALGQALADQLDVEAAALRKPVNLSEPGVVDALIDAGKAKGLGNAATRIRAVLAEAHANAT